MFFDKKDKDVGILHIAEKNNDNIIKENNFYGLRKDIMISEHYNHLKVKKISSDKITLTCNGNLNVFVNGSRTETNVKDVTVKRGEKVEISTSSVDFGVRMELEYK